MGFSLSRECWGFLLKFSNLLKLKNTHNYSLAHLINPLWRRENVLILHRTQKSGQSTKASAVKLNRCTCGHTHKHTDNVPVFDESRQN